MAINQNKLREANLTAEELQDWIYYIMDFYDGWDDDDSIEAMLDRFMYFWEIEYPYLTGANNERS